MCLYLDVYGATFRKQNTKHHRKTKRRNRKTASAY